MDLRIDRITRNLKDSVVAYDWLEEDDSRAIHFIRERLVISKDSKSDAKFRWDILVVLAKKYSEDLSENVRGGLMEKARQGWWPGSKKLGYVSERIGDDKRARWYIDESDDSEAPYIKRLFELYAHTDYSVSKCRDVLYEEGWSRRGKKVPRASVYSILSDIFYTGQFRFRGQLYRGKHEPLLISPSLFERVRHKRHAKSSGKYNKHVFLLRGPWLVCGLCGRRITAERQKGFVYYHHSSHGDCPEKKSPYIREEELEAEMLKYLAVFDVLKDSDVMGSILKALKESHASEIEYREGATKELQRKLRRYQNRLDRLYEDRLDGVITTEFYAERRERYEMERDEVMRALDRHHGANGNYFELGEMLLELASRATDIYKQRSPEEKRQLIKNVFSNLALTGKTLSVSYTKPFDVIAQRLSCPDMSGLLDDFRTLDWEKVEAILRSVKPSFLNTGKEEQKREYSIKNENLAGGG